MRQKQLENGSPEMESILWEKTQAKTKLQISKIQLRNIAGNRLSKDQLDQAEMDWTGGESR